MARAYARTRDERLRESLILHHQGLVRYLAGRFATPSAHSMGGELLEDLIQVGNIGLIKALDRYDPRHNTRFSTYATPTILGEIRRHLRDKTPAVKVPRPLLERHQAVRRTSLALTHALGRSPTITEIAEHLGMTEDQALEALEGGEALSGLVSLEAGPSGGGAAMVPGRRAGADTINLADVIGCVDSALGAFETRSLLHQALRALNARERQIIMLRFFEGMSQARVAKAMNLSQMHVSRLQQRALDRLRNLLAADGGWDTLVSAAVAGGVDGRQVWGYRATP
jgi:RNA polymerase sigma-B factor